MNDNNFLGLSGCCCLCIFQLLLFRLVLVYVNFVLAVLVLELIVNETIQFQVRRSLEQARRVVEALIKVSSCTFIYSYEPFFPLFCIQCNEKNIDS